MLLYERITSQDLAGLFQLHNFEIASVVDDLSRYPEHL